MPEEKGGRMKPIFKEKHKEFRREVHSYLSRSFIIDQHQHFVRKKELQNTLDWLYI